MSPWMHPLPVFERESRQEIGSIIVNEPSDTTGQEAVLDSVHHVIVTRPNIQNCLHGNLDLEGSDRSILQLYGLLLESTPSVAYAPGDLNGQIDVVVNCLDRSTLWLTAIHCMVPPSAGCASYLLLQQGRCICRREKL